MDATYDLATSGDNSPSQLLSLQRLADFPARAEYRLQDQHPRDALDYSHAVARLMQERIFSAMVNGSDFEGFRREFTAHLSLKRTNLAESKCIPHKPGRVGKKQRFSTRTLPIESSNPGNPGKRYARKPP